MRSHILAVAGRYKGRVAHCDVVNEAIVDEPSNGLRETVFSRVIGADYLDVAFRYARQADLNAKLFYNDFGGEGMNAKSQAIFNLVSAMEACGVPNDGVGLKMHYGLSGTPSAAEARQHTRHLGQAGFENAPAGRCSQATTPRKCLQRELPRLPQCSAVYWLGHLER